MEQSSGELSLSIIEATIRELELQEERHKVLHDVIVRHLKEFGEAYATAASGVCEKDLLCHAKGRELLSILVDYWDVYSSVQAARAQSIHARIDQLDLGVLAVKPEDARPQDIVTVNVNSRGTAYPTSAGTRSVLGGMDTTIHHMSPEVVRGYDYEKNRYNTSTRPAAAKRASRAGSAKKRQQQQQQQQRRGSVKQEVAGATVPSSGSAQASTPLENVAVEGAKPTKRRRVSHIKHEFDMADSGNESDGFGDDDDNDEDDDDDDSD